MEDLCWHIVWQKERLGYSNEMITANLNIDKSTVCRIMQIFANTGAVAKLPYPKDRAARKFTDPAKLLIVVGNYST